MRDGEDPTTTLPFRASLLHPRWHGENRKRIVGDALISTNGFPARLAKDTDKSRVFHSWVGVSTLPEMTTDPHIVHVFDQGVEWLESRPAIAKSVQHAGDCVASCVFVATTVRALGRQLRRGKEKLQNGINSRTYTLWGW